MGINPELLKQRMMKGALRGPLQEEIPTMARCKGKLEDGTRCHIIAAPGKDRCTKCDESGAELYDKVMKAPTPIMPDVDKTQKKPGRPAKRGSVSEAEQELQAATESAAVGENRPEPLTCAGLQTDHPVETDKSASTNHTEDPLEMVEKDHTDPCPDCIGWDACTDTGRPIGGCHAFELRPGLAALSLDRQISAAAPTPPRSHAPCAELRLTLSEEGKGLAALLRAPSAPPVGMFIPFASEELAALDESEVTPEIIREFVIMGLEGKLQQIPEVQHERG